MIYLSWVVYLGGLAVSIWYSHWAIAAGWLVAAPAAQWLYIRKFPGMSPAMGYGCITDEAAETVAPAPVKVTLYTALGCPFCPLLEERLETLRKTAGFALEKIDVTLRPDLLSSKGIRSVPAVEVRGRVLFGLVSTKDLAAAIAQPEAHGTPAKEA
jgi:glutaredoxin